MTYAMDKAEPVRIAMLQQYYRVRWRRAGGVVITSLAMTRAEAIDALYRVRRMGFRAYLIPRRTPCAS